MSLPQSSVLESAMREAIALARRGSGLVEPNPMVGAIVLRAGEIVGRGHHATFGGDHAEVAALRDAGERARGADLVVTLEPCSTTGKTPPCTRAILDAGIARVWMALDDPNPRHAGAARRILTEAGVEVRTGPLTAAAADLLGDFAVALASDRPYVVAKWASTLDGRIATHTGDSKWITGEDARRRGHEERARCQGILVGVGTVLLDDPELTVRHVQGRSPHRFVLDSTLRTPPDARLLDVSHAPITLLCAEAAPRARRQALEARGATVLVVAADTAGRPDLGVALRQLREMGIHRLLVEGGAAVHGTALGLGLVDRVLVFLAPMILGDAEARPALAGPRIDRIADARRLADVVVSRCGDDVLITGALRPS